MKSANIVLIGDGAIGSSYAFNLLTSGVGGSLGIIDVNMTRVQGDVEDLSDALPYVAQKSIYAASYADVEYADLVVITAGVAQKPGETRLQLLAKKRGDHHGHHQEHHGQPLRRHHPGGSNPVDVLTELVLRLS
ncbi:lactate/malate family dehydrogenase, partial [Lacticaseibacillus camelliae]|uniref:lactate/malate family dehydrogenase n=1 Tax=Lacticaseibacillus camelliae TaxID=381742 RepID=UPI000AB5EA39